MAEQPDLDVSRYPNMVRWYHPSVIMRTAWGAALSAWFANYADQRLTQEALDIVAADRLVKRYDFSEHSEHPISTDDSSAFWVDYVADLGDGFDSTYAVAHMLASQTLTPTPGATIPRGSLVILGGDLVYPSPSRERYKERMRRPYSLAQPDDQTQPTEEDRPKIFAIPGNHDWYDGLAAFRQTFCRRREDPPERQGLRIGNWRCPQHRSYFAIELPYKWWIWGVDIQLSDWVDQPQANYFKLIAEEFEGGEKIILCTAKPSWQHAIAYSEGEANTLTYVADIVWNAGKKADKSWNEDNEPEIVAFLAGDLHHYSRYESPDRRFHLFTSGGGGAFVHSTHQLNQNVNVKWRDQAVLRFSLGRSGNFEACYPPQNLSRRLLWHNVWFPLRNIEFAMGLGVLAWVVTLFFIREKGGFLFDVWIEKAAARGPSLWAWIGDLLSSVLASPMLYVLVSTVFVCLWFYTDRRRHWLYGIVGLAHASVQIVLFFWLAISFRLFNMEVLNLDPKYPWADGLLFAAFTAEMIIIGGLLSGFVWGIYLVLTSRYLNMHLNHAFSALRIDGYRNFLRLRVTENELIVYPIGLDDVPRRDEWKLNPNAQDGSPQPVFEPVTPLRPKLIEPPVVISVRSAGTADKNPSQTRSS